MNTQQHITSCLTQTLTPSFLEIVDESFQHQGHAGNNGGGHFMLTIASPIFKNKTILQCHRLIYTALGELMHTKIHALKIKVIDSEKTEVKANGM